MRTYRVGIIALFVLLRMGTADAETETEPAEITIHIRGQYKAVISALLLAADGGTTRTGIAELDSLAAIYGLRDISQVPFFGYRFRLTFPPDADGAAMAGAYRNLSYIQSVESVGSLTVKERHRPFDIENRGLAEPVDSYFLNDRAITRIPTKIGVGAMTTFATTVILVGTIFKPEDNSDYHSDPMLSEEGEAFLASLFFGLLSGYPLGVYLADPVESSCWMTFVGGYGLALSGGWVTAKVGEKTFAVVVLGSPVLASELSRLLPKRFRNPNPFKWLFGKFRRPSPRVSFGLVPDLQRGLAARATLRF